MQLRYLTKIRKSFLRRKTQLDYGEIRSALSRFELKSKIVLVHSSLSACGQISGGPQTVIRALLDWARPRTIAMPTHSYSYPAKQGQLSSFSAKNSPSLVGAITELFRQYPDVVRSGHPSHSLACLGPMAKTICVGHSTSVTPCGLGTPYASLLASDSAVLLFGAKLDSYTLFHTAEDEASVPYLYYEESFRCLLQDDSLICTTRRQDMNVVRRFEWMENWFKNRHLLLRIPLGRGYLLFIPDAAAAHAALVSQLREEPFFLTKKSWTEEHFAKTKPAFYPNCSA
jgi:aminoglycoside 3-N-acetyltransferase